MVGRLLQQKEYAQAATKAKTVIAEAEVPVDQMRAEWLLAKALLGQGDQETELQAFLPVCLFTFKMYSKENITDRVVGVKLAISIVVIGFLYLFGWLVQF